MKHALKNKEKYDISRLSLEKHYDKFIVIYNPKHNSYDDIPVTYLNSENDFNSWLEDYIE